jgi:hypothetical protein
VIGWQAKNARRRLTAQARLTKPAPRLFFRFFVTFFSPVCLYYSYRQATKHNEKPPGRRLIYLLYSRRFYFSARAFASKPDTCHYPA